MHSTRRAYVEIAAPCLRDCVGYIIDHGLEVIASGPSDSLGVVKLLIAGDVLPEECEAATDSCLTSIQTVTIQMTQERYGRQGITRVTNITVTKSAERRAPPPPPPPPRMVPWA